MARFLVYSLVIIISLGACASAGRLSGGDMDETAPRIIAEGSTPPGLTNFTSQDIELEFDEYVKIDRGQKILVSPELNKNPKYSLSKRTLKIEFDDETEFQENTTYIINFGNAIKDITENNPVENYSYVFSTGSYLDSLEITGTLTSEDGKPSKKTLVVLYKSYSDTTLFKIDPDYYTMTDDEGRFSFAYLPSDTFYIFGLDDKIINQRYDPPEEAIGLYTENPIILHPDSTKLRIELASSKESLPFLGSYFYLRGPNYYQLVLNQNRDVVHVDLPDVNPEIKNDTIVFWSDSVINSIVVSNADYRDTLILDSSRYSETISELKLLGQTSSGYRVSQNQKLELLFNQAISRVLIDSLQVVFQAADSSMDTTLVLFTLDSLKPRSVFLKGKWKVKDRMYITLDPDTIQDVYGQMNDSLAFYVHIGKPKEYSNLYTTITDLDSTENYLIKLVKKGIVMESREISMDSEVTINWGAVTVDNYELSILEDRNGNELYDPINVLKGREPEILRVEKISNLRAGWDVRLSISWKAPGIKANTNTDEAENGKPREVLRETKGRK